VKDIKVSINISPTHIFNQSFKVFLLEALVIRQIDPSVIILEITEEVMIEDFELVSEIIKPLRSLGIGISLDDFGTGYSSFNYLAQLELDELKIDKSFIDQIHKGKKVNAILMSIIQLTEAYGVHIVAEGVETKIQSDLMAELGCHMIQGYYYSKPLPIDCEV
jgi:EAL domain-containing protein (putative c-di-GMP-specific phosphodiesterase class I)